LGYFDIWNAVGSGLPDRATRWSSTVSDDLRVTELDAEREAGSVRAPWTAPTLRRMDAADAQAKVNPGVELHHHLTS
jgi:hypothetical protein